MGRGLDFIPGELDRIDAEGLRRRLVPSRVDGARITIHGKSLINLCSNDYLGLDSSPLPAGQLASSSRLLGGNDESYAGLEKDLASHKSHGAALVYPTGYMANMGVISALASKGDLVLSDELNHASIIDACHISGAAISVYAHNDMDDLESKVSQEARNKFIISEGIFSMDGDVPDIPRISEIAKSAGAATILDDAHGDFATGRDGRGTPDMLGSNADVYVSSLSKSLGSFGGYAASRHDVIDLCTCRSRQLIYTSALPRQLILHAHARLCMDRSERQERLEHNRRALAGGLEQLGYTPGHTHIMPIPVGGEQDAVNMARLLYEEGVFAQAIRYPTVPRGQARLRISATAWLSDDDIEAALAAIESARARLTS